MLSFSSLPPELKDMVAERCSLGGRVALARVDREWREATLPYLTLTRQPWDGDYAGSDLQLVAVRPYGRIYGYLGIDRERNTLESGQGFVVVRRGGKREEYLSRRADGSENCAAEDNDYILSGDCMYNTGWHNGLLCVVNLADGRVREFSGKMRVHARDIEGSRIVLRGAGRAAVRDVFTGKEERVLVAKPSIDDSIALTPEGYGYLLPDGGFLYAGRIYGSGRRVARLRYAGENFIALDMHGDGICYMFPRHPGGERSVQTGAFLDRGDPSTTAFYRDYCVFVNGRQLHFIDCQGRVKWCAPLPGIAVWLCIGGRTLYITTARPDPTINGVKTEAIYALRLPDCL